MATTLATRKARPYGERYLTPAAPQGPSHERQYLPQRRRTQHLAGLLPRPPRPPTAPARPPHLAAGRRPPLGPNHRRAVLLHGHRRPLAAALPRRPCPGSAGRAARPAAAGGTLGRGGGRLGPALDPARLRLAAQPLVLRRAGVDALARAPGRRRPRDGAPLAAPGRLRLAPAAPRAAPQ